MEKIVEWCLFGTSLCMKSEVWAAWAQGIGSMLAIPVALWIAQFQYRGRELVRIEAEKRRDWATGGLLGISAGYFLNLLQELVQTCERDGAIDVTSECALLEDGPAAGQGRFPRTERGRLHKP